MTQDEFIAHLIEQRDVPDASAGRVQAAIDSDHKGRKSQAIDWLKTLPYKGQPEVPEATEPGVYVLPNGTIWKVQQNRAKTRVYGMVWTDISGQRLNLDSERVHGEWTFVPGAIWHIKPEMRMDLDQARQFTLVFGQCAKCGRKLKAAESVEKGIGPVCRKYFSPVGVAA